MKLAVLFSGGKDSALAFYKAMQKEEVVCLISILSRNKESYMFHTPNIELTGLQAEAIGIPLILKETKGQKEAELGELKEALIEAKKDFSIQGVVTGAVASVYQAERIQKMCYEEGLWCFNPLWQMDQIAVLEEVIRNDFNAIITGVFAYPLDEGWLGRRIDESVVRDMNTLKNKYSINPAGEGGEIETTVIDGPIFRFAINIHSSEKHFINNSGVMTIRGSLNEYTRNSG